MAERWREAMERVLYGPGGFFVSGDGPGAHFRTSVHASELFATAIFRLVSMVDDALENPETLDVVDVGAGQGELLAQLARLAPPQLRDRLRLRAVELAPRPAGLPEEIAWTDRCDKPVRGLLLATEWLDNVPLDVATVDGEGTGRYVLVDEDGTESLGPPVNEEDATWLERWWPQDGRMEIGAPRDAAWASAVSTLERGLALSVDYGHLKDTRPAHGTLTGYRDGRLAVPVPDGSCDLTAHVAVDAVAAASNLPTTLLRQRDALAALGVSGARPPLELASRDPAGYVRALAAASHAAELTDPEGLGGHWWLVQTVGLDVARWLA